MEQLRENLDDRFDPEKFQAELVVKTKVYAEANYAAGDAVETRRLYNKLIDDCAEALLDANDKNGTMDIIRKVLVQYQYGNGAFLFGGGAAEVFYHDLVIEVAKKSHLQ